MAELQFGFKAEERLGAFDQLAPERQAYVTGLDLAQDVVLGKGLRVVVQFDLVVEVKGRPGVVVGVQLEFVADLADHVHVDVHVEVEDRVAAELLDDEGVVLKLVVDAETEVYPTLGLDADFGPAEEVGDQVRVELDVGQWVADAYVQVTYAYAAEAFEIVVALLLVAVALVFLKSQYRRGAEVETTEPFADDVHAGFGVIFHFAGYAGGVGQVDGVAVGVSYEIAVTVLERG